MRRVLALMTKDCFISRYCQYAETQTAGNLGYSLGIALALTAAVAPSNLSLDGPKGATSPNIYTLIVGPSGEGEKSLTIDVGEKVLMEVIPDIRGDDPTSDEALLKALQERSQQIWIYGELATFLSKTAGLDTRGRGIRDAFMEAYDGKSKRRRYSKGPAVHAENPRPVFLGACTPRHLEDHTSWNDWEAGFVSRFLIFYGVKERKLLYPARDDYTRSLRTYLCSWMRWSSETVAGESLGLDERAKRRWKTWDKEIEDRMRATRDERLKGVISRARLMSVKSALLVAWGTGAGCLEPWVLHEDTLNVGIEIAMLALGSALELSENIAPTEQMREQRRVFNAIGEQWTAYGDVLREANLTKRKSAEYIETLMEQGVITMTTQNAAVYFRQTGAGTVPYDYSLENLPPPPIIGV